MRLFLLCIPLLFLSSCMLSKKVEVKTPHESAVQLPAHIKKVVVADRTLPPVKGVSIDQIKGGFKRGKKKTFDAKMAYISVASAIGEITLSPALQVSKQDHLELRADAFWVASSPLTWKAVDSLCKQYRTDAVAILEFCNYRSNNEQRTSTYDGKTYQANYKILDVDLVWRVYDKTSKKVIDEHSVTESDSYEVNFNPFGAVWRLFTGKRMFKKRDVLTKISDKAGVNYAHRIAPYFVRNERKIKYRLMNDTLRSAKKFVKAGKWLEAERLWLAQKNNSNKKIASAAAHNLAIAAEKKYDYDSAVNWAAKAYELRKKRKNEDFLKMMQQQKDATKKVIDQLQKVESSY